MIKEKHYGKEIAIMRRNTEIISIIFLTQTPTSFISYFFTPRVFSINIIKRSSLITIEMDFSARMNGKIFVNVNFKHDNS